MKIGSELSDAAVLRELGARLAAARLARNLTQAALAEEAGVAKRTLERLEAGEVAVRLEAFVRVLRALGLADRLEVLVEPGGPGPVELWKLAGKRRQRATGDRGAAGPAGRPWSWGEES